MNNKLSSLFSFLKENHAPNKSFQLVSIKAALIPFSDSKSKMKSLLMDIANTQSKPKLDLLEKLWIAFDEETVEPLNSAQSLVRFLASWNSNAKEALRGKTHISDQVFCCLKKVPGFGEKTAALFVKNIMLAHLVHEELGFSGEGLAFLNDSKELTNPENMQLYLPVDAVIRHIFDRHLEYSTHVTSNATKSNFNSINKCISGFMEDNRIPQVEAIYWDDLWYWGFITQHGSGEKRKTEFNNPKYMSLRTSTAAEQPYKYIKEKAKEFLDILGPENK